MGFKANELESLIPEFKDKLIKFEEVCEKCGLKMKFSVGYRSPKEQDELYAQGRTKPGNKVTNAKGIQSQHCWGIAADVYQDIPGKAFDESEGFFNKIGQIAFSCGLGWGGNWKSFKDKPHIYLDTWGSGTSSLISLYGTPEKFMKVMLNAEYGANVNGQVNGTIYSKVDFIRDVQRCIGVDVDGIAGPKTLFATPTISKKENRTHAVVKIVQKWLNMNGHNCGDVDGVFGSNTEAGVKHYQSYIGFKNPDGIMDSNSRTWNAILK